MGFFSKLKSLFQPPKTPKVSTPNIKQKPKTITSPKKKPLVNIVEAVKKSINSRKLKKQFIPKQVAPPVQPVPIKTPEERAEIYVQETLDRIDRKVQVAKSTYTNKDGSSALQRYSNNAVIHDVLDYQLQEIHQYINSVIEEKGYIPAMHKLDRVNWEQFDSFLYYYPTCLDALPDLLVTITEATTPVESTSVFDTSAQSDFEDDEFNF